MVRSSLIILMVLIASSCVAQQKSEPIIDLVRKGLLRAQGTISPGWTVQDGKTNLYLQGDAEYYLLNRVSVRGEVSYFLDTQGNGQLKHFHSLFIGAQYHFPFKRFDPYVGFLPGASLIQVRNPASGPTELPDRPSYSKLKVSPTVSVSAGFNYYVWKYIHFLFNVKYVHSSHPLQWGPNYAIDEFRIAAGVGWNVNLIKPKK